MQGKIIIITLLVSGIVFLLHGCMQDNLSEIGPFYRDTVCPQCNGMGYVRDRSGTLACPACEGDGIFRETLQGRYRKRR